LQPALPPLSPPEPPDWPGEAEPASTEITPSSVAEAEAIVAAKETAEAANAVATSAATSRLVADGPASSDSQSLAESDAPQSLAEREAPAVAVASSLDGGEGRPVERRTTTILKAQECDTVCRPVLRPLNPNLPNVLIVGDQISQAETGYMPIVRSLLAGVADVQHAAMFDVEDENHIPLGVCGSSYGADTCMDSWLGKETVWDVIAFNWGLQDICPSVYGKVAVDDYVAAVRRMYIRMLYRVAAKGKIIWHTTTPVPPGHTARSNSDVIELNDKVEKMWSTVKHKPDTNDLYKAVIHACHANKSTRCYPEECGCPQLQRIDSEKFTASGKQFVGMLVASAIKDALG